MSTKSPVRPDRWVVTFRGNQTYKVLTESVRASDPDDAVAAAVESLRGTYGMSQSQFDATFRVIRIEAE